jgi:hypothetical protein
MTIIQESNNPNIDSMKTLIEEIIKLQEKADNKSLQGSEDMTVMKNLVSKLPLKDLKEFLNYCVKNNIDSVNRALGSFLKEKGIKGLLIDNMTKVAGWIINSIQDLMKKNGMNPKDLYADNFKILAEKI